MDQSYTKRTEKPPSHTVEVSLQPLKPFLEIVSPPLCITFERRYFNVFAILPVTKTVGDSPPSNRPAVLESKRSQSPTASTPVPANYIKKNPLLLVEGSAL